MSVVIDLRKYTGTSPMYSSVLIRSNNLSFENNANTVTLANDEKLMIRCYDSSEVLLLDSNEELKHIYYIKELPTELQDAYNLVNKLYSFKEGSFLVKQADSKSKVIRNMPLNIKQILCNSDKIVISSEYQNQDISAVNLKENIPLIVAFLNSDYLNSFVIYRAGDKLKLDTEVLSSKPLFYQRFTEFTDRIEETRSQIIDSVTINKDVILGKLFCNELDKIKEEVNPFDYKIGSKVELLKDKTILLDLVLNEDKQLEVVRHIELRRNKPPYHIALKLNQIALQERIYFDYELKKEVKEILLRVVAPLGTHTYNITEVEDKGILIEYL